MPDSVVLGTALDGYHRDDPNRPYAFCSVFKMEERKGYKELVQAFMREFTHTAGVVLLLRTYLHSGTGLKDDDFNITSIRRYSVAVC